MENIPAIRSPDAVRPVSRGGAAEEEGSGAHGVPSRDRRHQQPDSGFPGTLLWGHGGDQVRGAGADQCQGVRVEGRGQSRDHPRGMRLLVCVSAFLCVCLSPRGVIVTQKSRFGTYLGF